MTSDSARAGSDKPDSGFQTRGKVAFAVRHHDRIIQLSRREALIGRSGACDIIVHSALASRRHAKLTLGELGVTVEDLQSRNGVLVNGVLISEPTPLVPGDSVGIGDETLELVDIGASGRRDRQTITNLPLSSSSDDSDKTLLTRRADALQLLGGVVDKSLALGKGPEAERLLSGHLGAALREVKSGATLTPELSESAASYALKLARATSKAEWVNYAIELYRTQHALLPLSLVDDLYELLRKLPPIDRTLLGGYIDDLAATGTSLSPAERFTLKRIQGLHQLAGLL